MTATALASSRHRMLGTDVHLLVTEPEALAEADLLLVDLLGQVDRAASRFRPDSEVVRLGRGPARVSPLLAELVRAALEAARETGGLVDPTLGRQLSEAGYDRTYLDLPADSPASTVLPRPGCWRDVVLDGDELHVPRGVLLDLGATAKAWAADAAAARISALGTGVLVNLGGDLAVAGRVSEDGWPVAVTDRPGNEPVQVVSLATGGLATSSTTARTWVRGGVPTHHLLDPRTGLVAPSDWAAVTVAAASCLQANALSTAAVVLGAGAPEWLGRKGSHALLQHRDGRLERVGDWP